MQQFIDAFKPYDDIEVTYVDTVGKNAKKIKEYIQNQLQEDRISDQLSLVEYVDPFTGEKVKGNNNARNIIMILGGENGNFGST